MNEKTSYVIIAILLSVILAQYFLKNSHDAQEVAVLKEFAHDPDMPPETKTTPQKTVALVIEGESTPTKAPRIVELTLDEPSLTNLEKNINVLAEKVSVHRENRGWRVHYTASDNPMSAVGIVNNDLVLFADIDRALKNPQRAPLITRLESIFTKLEK